MAPDPDALAARIREADRSIDLATLQIEIQEARIADLEIENQRLRARLALASERLRRMTEGEL